MTNRIAKTMIFLAAAAFVLATVPAAHAAGPCVREAKRDYKDCGAACKETFQTAKDDTCLNRDHACVEVCRANRSLCRLNTGFDANIELCNNTLEADRTVCRNHNPPGSARDACVDLAQIKAFRCRDDERERAKPFLKDCRSNFRDCAQLCGPADPPVDARACIHGAKDAAKTCAGNCKEAFQVAKDDCRNLDHACVELCRAGRTTCRQETVEPTLASDLATCAANRQTGILDCNTRQPPLTPAELDTCKDGVQVAAFICRDSAYEAARPALEICRDLFQVCVKPACVLQ